MQLHRRLRSALQRALNTPELRNRSPLLRGVVPDDLWWEIVSQAAPGVKGLKVMGAHGSIDVTSDFGQLFQLFCARGDVSLLRLDKLDEAKRRFRVDLEGHLYAGNQHSNGFATAVGLLLRFHGLAKEGINLLSRTSNIAASASTLLEALKGHQDFHETHVYGMLQELLNKGHCVRWDFDNWTDMGALAGPRGDTAYWFRNLTAVMAKWLANIDMRKPPDAPPIHDKGCPVAQEDATTFLSLCEEKMAAVELRSQADQHAHYWHAPAEEEALWHPVPMPDEGVPNFSIFFATSCDKEGDDILSPLSEGGRMLFSYGEEGAEGPDSETLGFADAAGAALPDGMQPICIQSDAHILAYSYSSRLGMEAALVALTEVHDKVSQALSKDLEDWEASTGAPLSAEDAQSAYDTRYCADLHLLLMTTSQQWSHGFPSPLDLYKQQRVIPQKACASVPFSTRREDVTTRSTAADVHAARSPQGLLDNSTPLSLTRFPPGTNLGILTTLCWMLSEGRLGELLQEHRLVLTADIGIYRPIKHFIHSVTDWHLSQALVDAINTLMGQDGKRNEVTACGKLLFDYSEAEKRRLGRFTLRDLADEIEFDLSEAKELTAAGGAIVIVTSVLSRYMSDAHKYRWYGPFHRYILLWLEINGIDYEEAAAAASPTVTITSLSRIRSLLTHDVYLLPGTFHAAAMLIKAAYAAVREPLYVPFFKAVFIGGGQAFGKRRLSLLRVLAELMHHVGADDAVRGALLEWRDELISSQLPMDPRCDLLYNHIFTIIPLFRLWSYFCISTDCNLQCTDGSSLRAIDAMLLLLPRMVLAFSTMKCINYAKNMCDFATVLISLRRCKSPVLDAYRAEPAFFCEEDMESYLAKLAAASHSLTDALSFDALQTRFVALAAMWEVEGLLQDTLRCDRGARSQLLRAKLSLALQVQVAQRRQPRVVWPPACAAQQRRDAARHRLHLQPHRAASRRLAQRGVDGGRVGEQAAGLHLLHHGPDHARRAVAHHRGGHARAR